MSIYCPFSSDSTCQNDAAVALLGKIFGHDFIQAFVTGNSPAATAPPSGELAPVLFGALGHMGLVAAAFLFLCLIFSSVMHTAQDGEVFGQGSKKGWVVIRFITAVVFLLPTVSLYSVINILLLMIVLASNGMTNKANREFLQTAIQNPSPSFASIDNYDPYGYRAFALQKIRQYQCTRVLNANFSPDASIGEKVYPDGSRSYIKTVGGENIFHGELVDNNKYLDQGYFGAICGSSDYIVTNASALGTNIKYLTQNPDLDDYKTYKTRMILNIQNLKFQGISRLNTAITAYVNNFPDLAESPESYATIFKQRFDPIALDKIITDEIARTDSEITNYLTSQQNSYIQKTLDYYAQKGWTQVALAKRQMGEFQKDIYDAKAKVIYRGTNPDLQRMNREGVSSEKEKVMYNVLVRQMDMAINDYMKTPTVVTNLSTSDMENLIPEDLTSEDVSYKRIAADVEDANTTLVMKTMRVFIDTFVGSSATNNVDAITRMQTTGNVLHIVLTQLDGAISGLRIGLTVGGATGAVFSDNIGTAAQIAIGLVDYLSEKLAKIMVMGKLVAIYMAIIIPTLPYVFFLMAVIGWVLHILQAMTGLILWSIMHMIPDRTFVGSQMQGYLTVIALFFRPMLSLMGFYLAFMLSDPIITFTTDVFFTIMGATQFTSNGFIAALSQFFFLMAWVILYCTILLPIIFLIFSLPTTLADSVISWLGTNLSRSLGETNLAHNAGSAAPKAAGYYGGSGGSGGQGASPNPNGGGGGQGQRPQGGDGTVLVNRGSGSTAKPSGSVSSLPNANPSSVGAAPQQNNVGRAVGQGIARGGIAGGLAAYGAYNARQGLSQQASLGTAQLSSFNNANRMAIPNFSSMTFSPVSGQNQLSKTGNAPFLPQSRSLQTPNTDNRGLSQDSRH